MADPGTDINQVFSVAATPESLAQAFFAAASGSSGYQVTAAGAGSIVLTRRYTPGWAIAVAIIGALFALLGLLALLVKDTETLAITITPVAGGSRISINGRCTAEMVTRLNAVITSAPALAEQDAIAERAREGETKTCPRCAEQVKAAAQACRFCGHEFEPAEDVSPSATESA